MVLSLAFDRNKNQPTFNNQNPTNPSNPTNQNPTNINNSTNQTLPKQHNQKTTHPHNHQLSIVHFTISNWPDLVHPLWQSPYIRPQHRRLRKLEEILSRRASSIPSSPSGTVVEVGSFYTSGAPRHQWKNGRK